MEPLSKEFYKLPKSQQVLIMSDAFEKKNPESWAKSRESVRNNIRQAKDSGVLDRILSGK